MSVDQRQKHRFCGYCRQMIDGYYVDFDNHLEVCESIRANQIEKDRNDKDKTKP